MKIERKWAMPNKWTFLIKPIKELLETETIGGLEVFSGGFVDPFAGKYGRLYSLWTNDLDENMPAKDHKDALTYLREIETESVMGVIYDPPYSITQARQYGKKEFSSMKYWADCKNEVARIIKPSGKVICMGWTSMGLGKNRGFEMQRILLVPHGGSKNDTIVTVEKKLASSVG